MSPRTGWPAGAARESWGQEGTEGPGEAKEKRTTEIVSTGGTERRGDSRLTKPKGGGKRPKPAVKETSPKWAVPKRYPPPKMGCGAAGPWPKWAGGSGGRWACGRGGMTPPLSPPSSSGREGWGFDFLGARQEDEQRWAGHFFVCLIEILVCRTLGLFGAFLENRGESVSPGLCLLYRLDMSFVIYHFLATNIQTRYIQNHIRNCELYDWYTYTIDTWPASCSGWISNG
jgi:hypothetical protein